MLAVLGTALRDLLPGALRRVSRRAACGQPGVEDFTRVSVRGSLFCLVSKNQTMKGQRVPLKADRHGKTAILGRGSHETDAPKWALESLESLTDQLEARAFEDLALGNEDKFFLMWLWVKNRHPKWVALVNGKKDEHLRSKSWWFHFDPHPCFSVSFQFPVVVFASSFFCGLGPFFWRTLSFLVPGL